MKTASIPRPSFGLGYLISQLEAAIVWHDRDLAKTLRPGRAPISLGPLGSIRYDARVPDAVSIWFEFHDGTDRSRPIDPERNWFALDFDEALCVIKAYEPQGEKRGWTPLFRDAEGRHICIKESYSAEPLRLLETSEDTPLPSLKEWIWERLDAYGWKPRGSDHDKAYEGPIGRLFEELDAFIGRDEKENTFRPGASPAAVAEAACVLGLSDLPPDIEVWFQWHDGQTGTADEDTARIHPFYFYSALSLADALAIREQLLASELPLPTQFLPLFKSGETRGNVVLAVVLSDPGAQPLIDIYAAEKEISSMGTFRTFLQEAFEVRRREADPRITEVPEGYRLTEAQRWVLAVGAILTARNHGSHEIFAYERPFFKPLSHANGQKHWWGIYDTEGVCEQIESLLAPHEAASALDPSMESTDKAAAAWDLGRVPNLAGGAYHTRLMDLKTAWEYCLRAARAAQQNLDSWGELGRGYAIKFGGWNESMDEDDPDRYPENEVSVTVAELLSPRGLWSGLPWQTDLSDVPPPPVIEGRRFLVAATPASDRMLLHEALKQAVDGDRLVLDPGTYTRPLLVTQSIEIVAAAPGVVLAAEGAEPACVTVYLGAGVLLKGLTIEARGEREGCAETGVILNRGHLTVEGCDISGGDGIGIFNNKAVAVIRNTTIRATRNGAVWCSEDQTVLLEDCTVSGGNRAAVSFKKGGYGALRRCTVTDTGGHGVWAAGRVLIEDTNIEKTGAAALAMPGSGFTTIRRSTIERSAAGAVVCSGEDNKLEIEASAIRGVKGIGVELTGDAVAVISDSDIREAVHGVSVAESAAVTIFNTSVEETQYACVSVSPGGAAALNACTIGGSREGGSLLVNRGEARLSGCTVQNSCFSSIEVRGGVLLAEDTAIPGARGAGCFATEGAEVKLARCVIEGASEKGVWGTDGADLTLEETDVRASQDCGIVLGFSKCCVRGGHILDFKGLGILAEHAVVTCDDAVIETDVPDAGGVQAHSECRLICNGCRFENGDDTHLHLVNSRALLTRCRMNGGSTGVMAVDAAFVRIIELETTRCAYQGVEVDGTSFAAVRGGMLDGSGGEQAIYVYDEGSAVLEGTRLVGGADSAVFTAHGGRVTLVSCEVVPGKKGPFGSEEGGTVDETSRSPLDLPAPRMRIAAAASTGYEIISTDPSVTPDVLVARLAALLRLFRGEAWARRIVVPTVLYWPENPLDLDKDMEMSDVDPAVVRCYAARREDLEVLLDAYRILLDDVDARLDQLAALDPIPGRPLDVLRLAAENPGFGETIRFNDAVIAGRRVSFTPEGASCVSARDDDEGGADGQAERLKQLYYALLATFCETLGEPADADSDKAARLRDHLSLTSEVTGAFPQTALWETPGGDIYLVVRTIDYYIPITVIETGVRYRQ